MFLQAQRFHSFSVSTGTVFLQPECFHSYSVSTGRVFPQLQRPQLLACVPRARLGVLGGVEGGGGGAGEEGAAEGEVLVHGQPDPDAPCRPAPPLTTLGKATRMGDSDSLPRERIEATRVRGPCRAAPAGRRGALAAARLATRPSWSACRPCWRRAGGFERLQTLN